MDRRDLRAALSAVGVPDGYYVIEGVHQPTPTPPDFLYLRRGHDGRWETGVYERGLHHPVTRHRTEHEACVHLLRLLK
ncbi:hypothetical protein [Streptomyces xiaopingdaonensis]|uniref:hypothetical protein n=1 Tax=Streptomyces xiaopingdaonensis TaxID=1565415 RepID=UPI0003107011|nr:hypothetical protein [Streptomyces xiaopingdaonensis]